MWCWFCWNVTGTRFAFYDGIWGSSRLSWLMKNECLFRWAFCDSSHRIYACSHWDLHLLLLSRDPIRVIKTYRRTQICGTEPLVLLFLVAQTELSLVDVMWLCLDSSPLIDAVKCDDKCTNTNCSVICFFSLYNKMLIDYKVTAVDLPLDVLGIVKCPSPCAEGFVLPSDTV